MGEMSVSADPAVELVARGLGSCIGLAVVDRAAGVAGLAHIVLPESPNAHVAPVAPVRAPAAKFANTAVPELLARMRRAGATEQQMEVAMVGGARMFECSEGLDVGTRNDQAVTGALREAGLMVKARATGGNQGRTVRIRVAGGIVTVKVAGESPRPLLAPSPASVRRDAHVGPEVAR